MAAAWFYREGEARIFEDGVCPPGWVDNPAKIGQDAAPVKPRKTRKPKADE